MLVGSDLTGTYPFDWTSGAMLWWVYIFIAYSPSPHHHLTCLCSLRSVSVEMVIIILLFCVHRDGSSSIRSPSSERGSSSGRRGTLPLQQNRRLRQRYETIAVCKLYPSSARPDVKMVLPLPITNSTFSSHYYSRRCRFRTCTVGFTRTS